MKLEKIFDQEKIRLAVEAAEKKTSGEIVPLVIHASSTYAWVHMFCAAIFLVFFSLAFVVYEKHSPWPPRWQAIFEWQVFGAFLGLLLSYVPFLKRHMIPKNRRDFEVHKRALAEFMEQGLTRTSDRTGVLIYVSLFERQVNILADSGINDKVGPGFWQSQVDTLCLGMAEQRPSEALTKVIAEIGAKLAQNFPPKADDKNELMNELRIK